MCPLAPEEALIAAARQGDQRAFTALVRRNEAWLLRYLIYLVNDPALADDLAQETMVRAWTRLHQYRGEGFRAWVRRIATRLAFNRGRDRKTRRSYEERSAELSEVLTPADATLEATQALMTVLDRLPYPYREILVLRYVEEVDVRDIATQLDLGLSAAKMRLSRARQAAWDIYKEVADVT